MRVIAGRLVRASAVALLVACLTASSAAAANDEPFVGQTSGAELAVRFKGEDGLDRRIVVSAQRAEDATGTWADVVIALEVLEGRRLMSSEVFRKELDPAAFSVDPELRRATLDTTFAGYPLVAVWDSRCPNGSFCGNSFSMVGSSDGVRVSRSADARASVKVLGVSCEQRGPIYYDVEAATTRPAERAGEPEPDRPPEGFRSKGSRGGCFR